jgi:hypothetical protein
MGATVKQVDDNAVTLNVHGQLRRIPKSNAYNVIPLNAQAGSSGNAQSGSPADKNITASGNPSTPQGMALAFQKEQMVREQMMSRERQAIAEKLTLDLAPGTFQTTISTGDGTNTVILSTGDSNNL